MNAVDPWKLSIGLLGGVALALGGLWLLQGLGLVHIGPILCFADCEVIDGPSTNWTIIGVCVAAAGALAVGFSLRKPRAQ